MTLAFGSEHLRGTPSWNCRTCEQPWPCPKARADLTEEFRHLPSVLTVYMAAQMQEALSSMAQEKGQAPQDLYKRFLAWIRHTPSDPADDDRPSPMPRTKSGAVRKPSGQARYGTRVKANRSRVG
jgi:hypothetical protein